MPCTRCPGIISIFLHYYIKYTTIYILILFRFSA